MSLALQKGNDRSARCLVVWIALTVRKQGTIDMATQKETVEFLLAKLRQPKRFSARAMFGEYALYANGKVVALICADLLYVKILPASQALGPRCEKGRAVFRR
jgi:hypothetical protein